LALQAPARSPDNGAVTSEGDDEANRPVQVFLRREAVSPAHALMLIIYLGMLVQEVPGMHPDGTAENRLRHLEARFWTAYRNLRRTSPDPGEDEAFRRALVIL
jgi:hypothetical protein